MKFHGLKRMVAASLLAVVAPLAGVGSRGFLVDLVARYDRSLAAPARRRS